MKALTWLVAAWACAACGDPKPLPPPLPPTPATGTAPHVAPPSFDGWSLHATFPTMGRPCKAPRVMTRLPDVEGWKCGVAGRVSVETVTLGVEPFHAPPCEMKVLRPPAPGRGQQTVCVVGDHLVLASACQPCTSVTPGSILHARLSELTEEQKNLLDDFIGVPRGGGPRSPAAWLALADALPPAR